MNLPYFLASRLYRFQDKQKRASQPAIRTAIFGVAIGLAIMLISIAIVFGFKHSIRDKIIGFGSHIQVANFYTLQNNDLYPICIDDSLKRVLAGIDGVTDVSLYAISQGILKTEQDFLVITCKGIAKDYDTSFLKQSLTDGELALTKAQGKQPSLVISRTIADKLLLKTGDNVFAYFIANGQIRVRKFRISGIYQTNLAQFDAVLCFTDIATVQSINQWEKDQYNGAELKTGDLERLQQTSEAVVHTVNSKTDHQGNILVSQNIYETYPQLFSWLELLDLNVWIIIILMFCVACVSITSGLLIIIFEHIRFIGTLKALGASNSTIRHTFLYYAMFFVLKGMFWGNLAALALLLIQKYFGIIRLDPATYYVSSVPVEINLVVFALINVATWLLSILVMVLPSYFSSRVSPVKTLKYE
ncbi:MAG: ABC transporter permease [Prevotella sp.]